MKRKWTKICAAAFITASLLTGCGGAAENGSRSMMADSAASQTTSSTWKQESGGGVAYNSYDTAAEEEIAVEDAAEDGSSASSNQADNSAQDSGRVTLLEEKLVYRCDLEIETLDYPATMTSVKETIAKYGGIIQSESENDSSYDWYYENYRKTSGTMHNYLEVRIPSKDYHNFLEELDGVGKVISKSTSVDNISQQYYDTTAQIEALQIQEKNLLTMLEKCETIEDMITVEQRLSEVQYQLNDLQTSRRYMDMDVAYSYVNINVSEVMEYRQDTEPVRRNTFVDRLKNTIKSTGRGFLVFLEGLLFLVIRLAPYIVIIVVICFVFLRNKIKHFMEDRKIRKAERQTQRALRGQNRMPQQPVPQNTGWQMPPEDQMPQQPVPQNTGWQAPPEDQMPQQPMPQNTGWQAPSADQMPQTSQEYPQEAVQNQQEDSGK